jgi:glucose 1-dehydrogenase
VTNSFLTGQVLHGQRALVTGGSSGIGAGIARALAAAGARVVVNYRRSQEEAHRVVNDIRTDGGEAIAIQADVSKQDEVEAMFAAMYENYGSIDILINNAGMQWDEAFLDMSMEQWQKVIDVNLTGQFICAQLAAKEFVRRGIAPDLSLSAGKIICISSVHETIPWAGHVNYAASKGGLMMFMKTIAQELAHLRVRVNGIAPGAIRTRINRSAWETPEAEADLLKLIPYERIGEPADIGRAAVWLASDASEYITGETLYIDGGMTLYPGFREGG